MGTLFSKKEIKLVVVGLDNSGKTTMIKNLKPQKNQQDLGTTPTVGYQIEQFTKDDISFTMLDMSGQGKYREMWSKYGNEVDGIIFVIDSSDKLRFCIVKDELEALFSEPEIKNNPIPILFFSNKVDLPQSAKPTEIIQQLDLKDIKDREYYVQESNALTGLGIDIGLKWLDQKIQQRKQQKKQ